MIVDSHVHVGRDVFGERKGILTYRGTPQTQQLEEYLSKMISHEISIALVYPFPSPYGQFGEDIFWYRKENQMLVEICRKQKDKIYPIPAFNPRDKKSVEYVLHLVEKYELKGVKLHTRTTQYSPSFLTNEFMKHLERLDIPLILHIGSGKELELVEKGVDITLSSAISLALRYSNNRFVFAHLGRLHKDLEKILFLENVILDTAGLSLKGLWEGFDAQKVHPELKGKSPKEVICYLVEKGFEDKIIWGSDEPYGVSLAKELEYIKDNECLTPEQKEKILYKNAIKWFRL